MTVFKKTILGRILNGAGKVASVALPIIAGGGLVGGAAVVAKKTGLFSKVGNIFRKKAGGTVLGNVVKDSITKAANAGVNAIGTSIGESAGQFASSVTVKSEGPSGPVASGFKKGFSMDWIKNNVILVIGGVIGLAIIVFLIFRKRR